MEWWAASRSGERRAVLACVGIGSWSPGERCSQSPAAPARRCWWASSGARRSPGSSSGPLPSPSGSSSRCLRCDVDATVRVVLPPPEPPMTSARHRLLRPRGWRAGELRAGELAGHDVATWVLSEDRRRSQAGRVHALRLRPVGEPRERPSRATTSSGPRGRRRRDRPGGHGARHLDRRIDTALDKLGDRLDRGDYRTAVATCRRCSRRQRAQRGSGRILGLGAEAFPPPGNRGQHQLGRHR